jgi:putative transcriptional regulator
MRSRLRQERINRGWSQRETAERIGMTERAYRYIEHGEKNPSYVTAKKMQAIFRIPDEELLVPDSITSNIRQQEGGESYERQTQ